MPDPGCGSRDTVVHKEVAVAAFWIVTIRYVVLQLVARAPQATGRDGSLIRARRPVGFSLRDDFS